MTDQAGPTEGERTKQAKLVQLTAGVVAAYLSRNVTSPSELPHLIDKVGRALQEIGQAPEETPPTKPEPAVPVRRSISPNQLTCLVCGKAQKILKRHLAAAHELTPAAYRELFELKTRLSNGRAELRPAAFRDGAAVRLGAEATPAAPTNAEEEGGPKRGLTQTSTFSL